MALQDLAIFQDDGTQSLFTASGGRVVIGPEQLAQRFILSLLKAIGSFSFRLNRGTTYVTDISGANFYSELDANAMLVGAMIQAGSDLGLDEQLSDPADTKFSSAQVVQLVIAGDSLTASIKLISQAGTASTIVLPLSF